MRRLRILFLGTPEFGVPTLERLAASRHTLCGVISGPDAPKGRGRTLQPPAIKVAAERLDLPVWQPASLERETTKRLVWSLEPDLVVVVAFRILPPELLALPQIGSINLHASLLPKYRGPAPIQWALINGETTTGLTVFLLEPTVDTGRIIRQRPVPIGPDETYGELSERLSVLGADEVAAAVEDLAAGRASCIPQDESQATRAPKLTRADGKIDWARPAAAIRNRVRGVTPSPGAHTTWRGEPFGVLRVDGAQAPREGAPGQIVALDPKRGVAVRTGDGAVWLTAVQPPGGRAMDGAAWARGARPKLGERFSGE